MGDGLFTRHIRGRLYDISAGIVRVIEQFSRPQHSHLAHFQRTVLLAKSPFNSFRIPQIERLWGEAVSYIHIVRDRHEVACSMRHNQFEFAADGQLLATEEAWSRFVRRSSPRYACRPHSNHPARAAHEQTPSRR